MYPGCRFMDLHPRERDQMSYAPHHGPGFGHVTPQMKMDTTARPPVNYDSFPCYGCPYPLPYHGCYHNQVPDYHTYGLYHPHHAPPPPVYCHGSYPPVPGSYPFQYLPTPHYSVVDPRYEYDKKGEDHHCCGCPNHLCQQKENKNVKIEEQTSDDEKDRVASLVPSELKDQSYPVLWIPPGYKRNEEGGQTIKPESERESSFDKEAKGDLKPCAQEPGVWNGWLPIDLNNLKSLVQGRDEKGNEHHQNEDSKSSFPPGCMPRNTKQKDKLELKDGDQKSIWDPSQYGIFPLKFIENQDKKSMPEGDTENSEHSSSEDGPKTGNKNVVKKIIPVKQMDQSEEKEHAKDDQTEEIRAPKFEKNCGEMPLKHTDKKEEKKHLKNKSNLLSSHSKASKLPPVCLRVDPLPSRRTKSGSSRSLSPPENKKKSEMLPPEKSSSSLTMQGNNQQDMESSADSDLGRLQSEKKVKNIEVVDSTMRDDKIESREKDLSRSSVNASAADAQVKVSSGCQDGKGGKSDQKISGRDGAVKNVNMLSGEVTKDEKMTNEGQSGDVKCETGVNKGPVDTKESEFASTNGVPYQKFSEAEAAAIIQSAYRGFKVRRWEPLKKLKEIARIQGELMKVRLDVQNLVSSGSGNIDKQRILIGETIMNLLLQLDTMQGLHPSIRNIRKSVAKELVSLQEKLDSLTSPNSKLHECNESEEIFKSMGEEEREQVGEDRREQDITSTSHMESGVMELRQVQPDTATDVDISSVDREKSKLMLDTKEIEGILEKKEPDSLAYVELNKRHPEPVVELTEPSEREDHDSFLAKSKELPPIIAEDKLNPAVQLHNPSSLLVSDWTSEEDEVTKAYTEVPPRVLKQDSDAQVLDEGLQIDGGRCVVKQGELELVPESGLVLLGNESKETIEEEQQHTKLLTESPNLSHPEDSTASVVSPEGSSKSKKYIGAEGDSERDKELSGEDKLGVELEGALKEKYVSNKKEAENVFAVEGDDKPVDVMRTAVEVEMEESSDIEEVAITCEAKGEGDEKSVDDMWTADAVGVETKEILDIKEAANVCKEGDDKPVDDMQTSDTFEHEKDTLEDNENSRDVGPFEDMGSIEISGPVEDMKSVKNFGPVEDMESNETSGPETKDQSMVTSDSQVKQQKPSFMKDTRSGEEVHTEEIADCNIEQKMAVDEDQEMWEDKFANKEVYQKHSDGNTVDLPRDEVLMEEELGTEKVNKQTHREFANGERGLAGEELVAEQPQKEVEASMPILGQISSVTETESDKKLVEENEKLKETVEKLIAAGKEQLTAISSLSERVKDLEKKLSKKKKLKMRRHKSASQHLVQV